MQTAAVKKMELINKIADLEGELKNIRHELNNSILKKAF